MRCLTDSNVFSPREGYFYQIKGIILSIDLVKTTVTSKTYEALFDFSRSLKDRSSEITISGSILIEDRDSKANIRVEIGNIDLQNICHDYPKIGKKKNQKLVEVPMTEDGFNYLIRHRMESKGMIDVVAQCIYLNGKMKVFRILRKEKEPSDQKSLKNPEWILKSVDASPDNIQIVHGDMFPSDFVMLVKNSEYPEKSLILDIQDRRVADCIDFMLYYRLFEFFNPSVRIFYKTNSNDPNRMEFLGIQNGDIDQSQNPKTIKELKSIPDSIINRFQNRFVGYSKVTVSDPDSQCSDLKHKIVLNIHSSGHQNESFALEVYSDDSRIVKYIIQRIESFNLSPWSIYYDKASKKITGFYPQF